MNLYNLIKQFIKLADDELWQEEPELTPEEHDEFEEKSNLYKNLEENPFNEVEDLLMEYDIYPIVSGSRETALIGEGSFNKVFEVTYKGKHAVAKITGSKKDLDMMLKLSELRSEFGEYGKHFPIVYTYFEDTLENKQIYCLIVEYLWPINSHLKELLFKELHIIKDDFKSEEDINQLKIKKIKEFKDKFSILFKDDILNKILEKVNLSFDQLLINQIKIILKQCYDNIDELLIFVDDVNRYNNEIIRIDLTKFNRNLYFLLRRSINIKSEEKNKILKLLTSIIEKFVNTIFPEYSSIFIKNNDEAMAEILPESKSLIECLKKLKEKGIYWADMRHCNVMERPKTRDLVISDPGMFEDISS